MKKSIIRLLLLTTFLQLSRQSAAQTWPFNDDFESYTAFQTPPGYQGDMQLYLVHGTNSSKGLIGFMNNFNFKDSIITPWIGPVGVNGNLSFDFRLMSTTLYPSTQATLNADDVFTVYVSTDSINYTALQTWNNSNFTPNVNFTLAAIDISAYAGQNIKVKFVVSSPTNPDEFFLDIDNLGAADLVSTGEVLHSSSIRLYPNPVSSRLTIAWTGNSQNSEIKITDLLGKTLYETSWPEYQKTINIETSGWLPGIYLVNLDAGGKKQTYRFQKMN